MNAAQAEDNTEDVRKEDLQEELRILKEKHQNMEKEYNTLKKEKEETDKKLCTKCKNNGRFDLQEYLTTHQVENYEEFAKICARDWTEDSYKRATLETGENLNGDSIILLTSEEQEKSRWHKVLLRRYPEIAKSAKMEQEGGYWKAMEQTSTVRTERGMQRKERKITDEIIFKTLLTLGTELKGQENKDVCIIPTGDDTKKIRKMANIAFSALELCACDYKLKKMSKYFSLFVVVLLFVFVSADSFHCTPGTTYIENNCNTCFCSPSGMLACGMRRCIFEWRFTLYNCKPEETYFDECNRCWCVEGFGTICTNRKCA
ncbi:hypothetical protein RN001_015512 [Aquatica leii]|uniref:Pacifastin domain-containing protein n=1 Tax=Aquatica leii TaxID=1421715 RepID=A0AAN7QCN2_9COLE|nr:hypothetical protein RN001_015512 [Aquatica leii]